MITAIGDKTQEDIKKQNLKCVVPKQEKDAAELKEESVPVQYLSRMLQGPSAQGLIPKTTIIREVRAGLACEAPTSQSRFSVNGSSYLRSMVKLATESSSVFLSVFPFMILL